MNRRVTHYFLNLTSSAPQSLRLSATQICLIITRQFGPSGRRDKPPPPSVVRVEGDKRTNKQKEIAIAQSDGV